MGAVGWVRDADSGRHDVTHILGLPRGSRRSSWCRSRASWDLRNWHLFSCLWIGSVSDIVTIGIQEVGGCDPIRVSTVDQFHVSSASGRDKDVFGSESARGRGRGKSEVPQA